MSMQYLGEEFDVHTGGVDHIPVHHNNEIAQSEAATGKILARYWLHNNHLTIGEDKMAKSGENFITLSRLIEKGISPLAYRYFLLTARYSTRMDYSEEAINGAQNAYDKLIKLVSSIAEIGTINLDAKAAVQTALNNDLDTPKALAIIWEYIKSGDSPENVKATLLDFDTVLGLGLNSIEEVELPEEIKTLVTEREQARNNKDFTKSDELRNQIIAAGFEVEDTAEGQKITKNY
jgi:cysteinyl-tRNA synthetase